MSRKDNAQRARMKLDAGLEVEVVLRSTRKNDGSTYLSASVDGRPVSGASGGGYCREGVCLGDFVNLAFPEELRSLDSKGLYALSDGVVDGATGVKEVGRVLARLGYTMTNRYGRSGKTVYAIKRVAS